MQIVQNAQTAPDRAGMYICMGSMRIAAVSRSGERGDGGGPDAGDRYPIAADECRRFEHAFGFYDAGACEQCPAPAFCELSRPGCRPSQVLEVCREFGTLLIGRGAVRRRWQMKTVLCGCRFGERTEPSVQSVIGACFWRVNPTCRPLALRWSSLGVTREME